MSDWDEAQIVRAVLMALAGETAVAIAHATGKEAWQIRNRLALYDIPLVGVAGGRGRMIPVTLSPRAHGVFEREAASRGFCVAALLSHVSEIIAGDGLFCAVLGDHRSPAQ